MGSTILALICFIENYLKTSNYFVSLASKKSKLKQFGAKIFTSYKYELLSLWLAGQVYEVLKDESVASKANKVAKLELKYNNCK